MRRFEPARRLHYSSRWLDTSIFVLLFCDSFFFSTPGLVPIAVCPLSCLSSRLPLCTADLKWAWLDAHTALSSDCAMSHVPLTSELFEYQPLPALEVKVWRNVCHVAIIINFYYKIPPLHRSA